MVERDQFMTRASTSRMTDSDQSTTRASSAESASATERNKQGRGKPTGTNDGFKGCCERLQSHAETIELLGRLYGHGATLVDAATSTLTTEHTARESIAYQSFLQDILRHAGPGFVVLCAASLGKRRVIQLNAQDRADLVRHIRDNKAEIHFAILDSLAIQHNVPSLDDPRIKSSGKSGKRIQGAEQTLSRSSKRRRVVAEVEVGASVDSTGSDQTVPARHSQWEIEAEGRIGDIYELTVEDAQAAIISDQIRGKIWLTDTYYANTSPIITIPISEELRQQLAKQRPRVNV